MYYQKIRFFAPIILLNQINRFEAMADPQFNELN